MKFRTFGLLVAFVAAMTFGGCSCVEVPEIGKVCFLGECDAGTDADSGASDDGGEVDGGSDAGDAGSESSDGGDEVDGGGEVDGGEPPLLQILVINAPVAVVINEAATAIANGLTVSQWGHVVHAHPSIAEALPEAALDCFARSLHLPQKK